MDICKLIVCTLSRRILLFWKLQRINLAGYGIAIWRVCMSQSLPSLKEQIEKFLKITLISHGCLGPCHILIMKSSTIAKSFVIVVCRVLDKLLLIPDAKPYINFVINIRTDNASSFLLWIYCYGHSCSVLL